MAITLGFFNDAGLTSPATTIPVAQASSGASPAVSRIIYLGSTAVGKKFQAESNPGVDAIAISIADALPGAGVEAAHVKLALSAGGLDSAVAGAALPIGVQLLSGAGNSLAVHLRVDTPALAAAVYNQISLATSAVVEVPV